MASTTVLSRPQPGQLDTLVIDAVIQETHDGSNTITSHPVEEGSDISDHMRPEPLKLRMECVISASPISGSAETVQLIKGVSAQAVAKFDDKRVSDAIDKLDALRTGGKLFAVITTLDGSSWAKSYSSMAFESASITRDVKTQAALKFSCSLKQIRIVKNKLTTTVVSKEKKAQPKKKTGATGDQPTDPEVESQANKLYNGVSGQDARKFIGGVFGGG